MKQIRYLLVNKCHLTSKGSHLEKRILKVESYLKVFISILASLTPIACSSMLLL